MSDDAKGAETWEILGRGEGSWVGEESMPPAPWAPDGMESEGRMTARRVLGGRGLASEYQQRVGGRPGLTSHTLIRWDPASDGFVMHFVSDQGGEPTVLPGRRDGDRLIFEGDSPMGPMRQTFRYGDGEMDVTSESPAPDGEGWTTTFEGSYRREPEGKAVGTIGWFDLTVEDAEAVRDFWADVVGWKPEPVDMGEYADFNMVAPDAGPAAGVCHARGANADLPPVWLAYVIVEDLDASLAAVDARGGERITPVRSMGGARYAVVRDPAGAALALYQPA